MKNIKKVFVVLLMIISIPMISYAQDCGYSKVFRLFNMWKAGHENCGFKFKVCDSTYYLIVCASRPSSYDIKMFEAENRPMLVRFSNEDVIEIPFSYQFTTELERHGQYLDWEWTWQYEFKTKEDFEKFVKEDIVKVRIEYKNRGIVDYTEKMMHKDQSLYKQNASKEALSSLATKSDMRNNF